MNYLEEDLEEAGFGVLGELDCAPIVVTGGSGVHIVVGYMPSYCGGYTVDVNPRALAKARKDIAVIIYHIRADTDFQIFWMGQRGPVTAAQGQILSELGFSQENEAVWVNH